MAANAKVYNAPTAWRKPMIDLVTVYRMLHSSAAHAPGVPYLSVTECKSGDDQIIAWGTLVDQWNCDHVAAQWREFPEDPAAIDWRRALRAARKRWSAWLACKPQSDASGRIDMPLRQPALANVTDLTSLIDVTASPARAKQ